PHRVCCHQRTCPMLCSIIVSRHSHVFDPVVPIGVVFFFFNDTAPTEIYTLSLHDALPISAEVRTSLQDFCAVKTGRPSFWPSARSEEHTSELQSLTNLVCRLLLEKKKKLNAEAPTSRRV